VKYFKGKYYLISYYFNSFLITSLKFDKQAAPKSYKSATIFYSDIVSFTSLSAGSTANEIIDFLNRLYKIFDSVIDNYDVFKVIHIIILFLQFAQFQLFSHFAFTIFLTLMFCFITCPIKLISR